MKSRPRIPSLTVAALALTHGCGGSQDSITRIVNAVCKYESTCDPDFFREYGEIYGFDDVDSCTQYYVDQYNDYRETYGAIYSADCLAAYADYYECYFSRPCEDIKYDDPGFGAAYPPVCQSEYDRVMALCENAEDYDDYDDYGNYAYDLKQSPKRILRKRIPALQRN